MKLQEIKEKRKGFGQFLLISGQISNCSKINKLALLTLRAEILKYTCNPPKHLISQYSENSDNTLKVLNTTLKVLNSTFGFLSIDIS